ncbi:MAG: 2-amino-4-hydroxy-6-hydroxymethyldihydropteridine diphosphokinase [Gammaproteobacteria bacterium]|nr:2-amino-4-hydroxy-6-hydroxymethyldihydropteridine diphosphokinase [Gammaproteobacteria bacterium]
MVEVFVSIGSNVEPERHVRFAVEALQQRFGELRISTVYQTAAVGFDGDDFLNLVVGFRTRESVEAVDQALDGIERDGGRDQASPRFSPRTIDLDLLLYGDLVMDTPDLRLPRNEILKYAFVLAPLVELAAGRLHPETGRPLASHWQEFDKTGNELLAIDFHF